MRSNSEVAFLQRKIDLQLAVSPDLEFTTLTGFAQNRLAYLQVQFDRFRPRWIQCFPIACTATGNPTGSPRIVFTSTIGSHLTTACATNSLDHQPISAGKKIFCFNSARAGYPIVYCYITQVLPSGNADQTVFSAKNSNWAIRAGLGWDPFGTGHTVVRASYGIFYDRHFDNLWQT